MDLIDRQAEIADFEWCKAQAIDKDKWQEAIDRIKALPSAEEESFEWCDNCKEYDPKEHCCHRWTKVIRNTVEDIWNEQRWIPIKWHDCTDEDREKYGFSNDIVAVFDCEMPYDDQPILVTTSHGYVNQDVCYIDDGYSLDSGWDWIDDIKAWMPLPEPYKDGN